jgi:hypothetical protein
MVLWNPKLSNPTNTLPAMQIEVFSILQDKIFYTFPNIENRVEPFEDDIAKMGMRHKPLEELEPIILTSEILEMAGFIEKGGLLASKHFEKGDLQLTRTDSFFQRVSVTKLNSVVFNLPVKNVHQLQNLYFALTGDELEVKPHGQQA